MTNRRIRKYNSTRILTYIWRNQGATVEALTADIGIPRPTVYRLISELVKSGHIMAAAKRESTLGRKAVLYSLNPCYRYVLGVNLDKLYVKTFIADLTGKVIVNWSHALKAEQTKEEMLGIMEVGIDALIGTRGAPNEYAAKIGIISVGATASIASNGETIHVFNSRECLNGFNIVQYFQERYGVKTILAKSSTLRTLAYLRELGDIGINDYVYIYIGTGIGAGIVIDGKYYRGFFGAAGEFARAPLGGEAGRTLEGSYSLTRLHAQIQEYLGRTGDQQLLQKLALLDGMDIELNQRMMRMADQCLQYGDEEIRGIVEKACGEWGRLCGMIAAFYDPRILVIGGEVNSWTPNIYDRIRANFVQVNDAKIEMMPARPILSWDELIAVNALEPLMDLLSTEPADTPEKEAGDGICEMEA